MCSPASNTILIKFKALFDSMLDIYDCAAIDCMRLVYEMLAVCRSVAFNELVIASMKRFFLLPRFSFIAWLKESVRADASWLLYLHLI